MIQRFLLDDLYMLLDYIDQGLSLLPPSPHSRAELGIQEGVEVGELGIQVVVGVGELNRV